jgi:hypothetical protein
MRSRTILLIQLGLNLAFVGIILILVVLLKGNQSPPRFLLTPRPVTNTVTQIAVRKINATNLLAALASRQLSWANLESTNYSVYIANLRAFGVPEETIRDIIITDIAKFYAQRRAALRAQAPPAKFWEPGDAWESGGNLNADLRQQLRDLDQEERQLVRELLGVDLSAELARYSAAEETDQEYRYSFLTPDKRDKLRGLQDKYDALEQEVYARTKGLVLDEDQEELRQIGKAREAELAQLLSPEELEEHQVRNSTTANALRYQLAGFNPSEEEFRTIFRLQKTFDDEFGQNFDATDEKQTEIRARAQQEAQEAMDEEVKKVLGGQRYAEYERAQDSEYKSLVQLADRFELARDVVNKVYDFKATAERQKEAIENNASLTEEQRRAALAAIAQETERTVSQFMGDKVFKTYRKAGGQWINGLGVSAVPEPVPAVIETPPPPPASIFPPLPPIRVIPPTRER